LGGPRQEILLDMYYGSRGEYIFPDEDMTVFRRAHYKLIEGHVRDPHWYSESSSDAMNTTDTTWKPKMLERAVRFIEWIFGVGRADSFRVMLTHQIFQPLYLAEQRAARVDTVQLYDVEADPSEKVNLAKDFPDVVADLHKRAMTIRDARPEQQKFWFTVRVPDEYHQNLKPGDCRGLVPKDECHFVHPWLADDVEVSTVPLVDAKLDSEAKLAKIQKSLVASLMLFFLMLGSCWMRLARRSSKTKVE